MDHRIHHYSDYRRYLRDRYQARKDTPHALSLRELAARAGAQSSAYMKFVMDGDRNLSDKMIFPVARAFDIPPADQPYFEALVKFNQARTLDAKNVWFDRLVALHDEERARKVPESHYEIFAQWYHPVIRELVVMPGFDGNWAKLGRRLTPPITAAKARKSVELLCALGYLRKTEHGYEQVDPAITTGPAIQSHRILQFQQKMTTLAAEAFDRLAPEHRFASSTTFGLTEESYRRFCKRLRALRKELIAEAVELDHPDRVAQLAINLFLCSKPDKRGGTSP
jgi:uncharacterized protein (TIGR02147 family)